MDMRGDLMAFILSGIAYGILEVFLLHILLKSALSGDLKKSILPLFNPVDFTVF